MDRLCKLPAAITLWYVFFCEFHFFNRSRHRLLQYRGLLQIFNSGVPAQPNVFTAVSTTSRTITVTWEPGFNGGLTQTFTLVGKVHAEEEFKRIKSG